MKTKRTFKIKQGEQRIQQGDNEIHISGTGKSCYLWVGGRGCYGHLSGKRTLENLAYSILEALNTKKV